MQVLVCLSAYFPTHWFGMAEMMAKVDSFIFYSCLVVPLSNMKCITILAEFDFVDH